jgi:hemerythrin-like domain-containing protein
LKATEILMSEHRVIERVLEALETACGRIGQSPQVGAAFFLDASEFIRDFADGFHHMKEEDVLFLTMEANGMPRSGGPIAVMLMEHDMGRRFNQALRAAAEKWSGGDASAQADVVDNAMRFADLLRQHIMKEDTILFPMAAQVIPPDEHDRVLEEFARVERERTAPGTREKYLALAASLEERARG